MKCPLSQKHYQHLISQFMYSIIKINHLSKQEMQKIMTKNDNWNLMGQYDTMIYVST